MRLIDLKSVPFSFMRIYFLLITRDFQSEIKLCELTDFQWNIVNVMEFLNNMLRLHARSEAIWPRKGCFPPSLVPNLDEKINKSSFEAHTLDEIPLMGLP
jgi:hypothetical protein